MMKTGIEVRCMVCGKVKVPRGRSCSPIAWDSYCQPHHFDQGDGCDGYAMPPLVGDLWPNETAEGFGFPCSDNGTADIPQEAK